MASQLEGKVAVVTGSSSGLGEAIAVLFASQGAKVTLCGRSEERLKAVLEKAVKASGGHQDRFLIVQGDLNNRNVRKEIISKTVEKFGRLDILVPNAGAMHKDQSISTATEAVYDDIMDTNLKSVFFLIQEAIPYLEKSKGNIISVSAAATNMCVPSIVVSLISKVAQDHLTKCLAVDLGEKGIRVNSVNPGFLPTRMMEQFSGDKNPPPTGRMAAPEDVAKAALFLASDSASFITGEHIKVDAGGNLAGKFGDSVLKK
ncbi:hypothetical protein BsWGS_12373 [Bradybaena similaris]